MCVVIVGGQFFRRRSQLHYNQFLNSMGHQRRPIAIGLRLKFDHGPSELKVRSDYDRIFAQIMVRIRSNYGH